MIEIALKGVKASPINVDTLNYINSLMSNYTPMMIVSKIFNVLNMFILITKSVGLY